MDALGLYDIYEYTYLPFWQTFAFKICVAMLSCALIGIIVYFAFKRYRLKTISPWKIWDTKIAALHSASISDVTFYSEVAMLIKDCSISMLNAPSGVTDAELASFLKAERLPAPVRALGAIVERSNNYKYDPVFTAEILRKKELLYTSEAFNVIKQIVTKQ